MMVMIQRYKCLQTAKNQVQSDVIKQYQQF